MTNLLRPIETHPNLKFSLRGNLFNSLKRFPPPTVVKDIFQNSLISNSRIQNTFNRRSQTYGPMCYVPERYHVICVPLYPSGRTTSVPSALIEDTYPFKLLTNLLPLAASVIRFVAGLNESHISRVICISYGRESYQQGGSHPA